MTPISLNISDIEARFNEIYKDPHEAYLWPSYLLGYSAGLLPKVPDLGIPGQDAHMIVAAHLGIVLCEIHKSNQKFMEGCHETEPKITSTRTPIWSGKGSDWMQ